MKIIDITINRQNRTAVQTTGTALMYVNKKLVFTFKTLELEEDQNKKQDDCIPIGDYKAKVRYSDKYGRHLHIQNVPNRDLILIHNANYNFQLLGCIGVGAALADINKDGQLDTTDSKKTLAKIMALIDDKDNINIKII